MSVTLSRAGTREDEGPRLLELLTPSFSPGPDEYSAAPESEGSNKATPLGAAVPRAPLPGTSLEEGRPWREETKTRRRTPHWHESGASAGDALWKLVA